MNIDHRGRFFIETMQQWIEFNLTQEIGQNGDIFGLLHVIRFGSGRINEFTMEIIKVCRNLEFYPRPS